LLKAELLHARIRKRGFTRRERVFSSVDLLGAIGCTVPWLANALLSWGSVRGLVGRALGLAPERPFPPYAKERFDRWFLRRTTERTGPANRGPIWLWDDTFVRFHEPHIGKAAVAVLERAGYEVRLVPGRKCCGRPAFSQGHLDRVKELGRHNLGLLTSLEPAPILFLEPSCYSMFAEDYRELGLPEADQVAQRCFLFEQFIETLLSREPDALRFAPRGGKVVIHGHCHVKALTSTAFLRTLGQRLPGREVSVLDTGCCGMAGAFGMLQEKYELSVKVAEPLLQQVRGLPYGSTIVASGTSCRHQIDHLARVRSRHMAEVLADALA
jgi:Fe-S oxidoreductase